VKETTGNVADTHKQIDGKLDGLYKLLQQWTFPSEQGSQEKTNRPFPNPPSPQQATTTTLLTAEEMAFLKKQEVAGKISLHHTPSTSSSSFNIATTNQPSHTFQIPHTTQTTQPGMGYTQLFPDNTSPHTPLPQNLHTTQPHLYPHNTTNTFMPDPARPNQHSNFSLSIARHKLDFPIFAGDEPVNWLRRCEKYFALACVPVETWFPLATLHCYGMAQTWWRSLRAPANFIHWAQFCQMVFSRFSGYSSDSSVENFHHLKQTTSVSEYIQKFEELMALMQMEHPGLTEQYFISSFIAGLKEGIKHYLIPHSPPKLSDTYWQA
jgi:hypothetical protein